MQNERTQYNCKLVTHFVCKTFARAGEKNWIISECGFPGGLPRKIYFPRCIIRERWYQQRRKNFNVSPGWRVWRILLHGLITAFVVCFFFRLHLGVAGAQCLLQLAFNKNNIVVLTDTMLYNRVECSLIKFSKSKIRNVRNYTLYCKQHDHRKFKCF